MSFLTLQRRDFHKACAHVQWLAELHSQLPCTVRCRVVPHSLGPKGKWSGPFSAHSYSFHPTVLREKAWSTAQRPAVPGSGVRADLLRGRGAPIQSVIKHTVHPADPHSSCRSCGLASASLGCLRSNTSRHYLWPCVISLDVSWHQHTGLNSKHSQPGFAPCARVCVCVRAHLQISMKDCACTWVHEG